ncbi:MAG: hypothetical protein H6585_06075 [Flavobacteriales bacterium]|nr:hypothetical protein [Flavobacteriales bacterium]
MVETIHSIKHLIIFLLLLAACGPGEKPFDKKQWADQEPGTYRYRESMVGDLMQSHLHKGMKVN